MGAASSAALLGPDLELIGQSQFGRGIDHSGDPEGGTHLYKLDMRRRGLRCSLMVVRHVSPLW